MINFFYIDKLLKLNKYKFNIYNLSLIFIQRKNFYLLIIIYEK